MAQEIQNPALLFGRANDTNSIEENATTGENISVDIDGIWTANYVYVMRFKEGLAKARETKSHPYYGDLIKTNWGVQRLDGDLGRFTLVCKGVEKGAYNVRYNISSATQAEPIETHPFFDEGETIPDDAERVSDNEDAYGYRFGDPIDSGMGGGLGSKQAIFETLSGNKIFKGFPLNSKFDLQGVTQFLNIGMSLRCTIVTHADNNFLTAITTDDVEKGGGIYYVGQIADPPSEIAPNVDLLPTAGGTEASHNWLVTKCDVEIIGSAMRQTVEFTLSGYLGWNRLIYNLNANGFSGSADTRFDSSLPTGGSSLQ